MTAAKIAFLIERNSEYRYLGTVIDAALQRNHDVVLCHDYGQPSTGRKAYQFPAMELAPRFYSDGFESHSYQGKQGLISLMETLQPDCVIASRGPTHYLDSAQNTLMHLPWVAVQEHFDFTLFGLDRITSSTVNCVYTPYWINLIKQLYPIPPNQEDLFQEGSPLFSMTGCTQADGLQRIDPDAVREQWGIPKGKPVVVYIPSNKGPAPYFRVLHSRNAITRALHIAHSGRFRLLPYAWKPLSDRALVKAIRQFCDRNGAFLLVKSRYKNPVPDYLQREADLVVMDEAEYPAGIVTALSVADLCICAYPSNSTIDAAGVGVPVLSLFNDPDDWPVSRPNLGLRGSPEHVFFTQEPGGPFNYPGCSYAMPLLDAVKNLGKMDMANFPLDARARDEYVTEYLGHADGKNGERVLMAVEGLLSKHSATLRQHAD